MMVFIATFSVFALVLGAMALGTWLTGHALKGSCGGPDRDCLCRAEGRIPGSNPACERR